MHRARWLAITILSVFGVFALLGGTPERAEAQSYEAAEVEVIELINAYRQENGLGTLSLSSPLSVASERHSEDMGTYGFFAHDTAQSSYYQPGWGHSERIAQEGYEYDTFTAENLAYGQATPQEAFEAWRNSPGHNAAMLGDYSVVGVGLVNVGGVPYWTTVFGAEVDPSAQPVGAAPSSGEAAPAEEDPTAQAGQYDNAQQTDTVADEQYAQQPPEQSNAGEQYGSAPDAAEASAVEQYGTPDGSEEAAAVEQYDDADDTPVPDEAGTSAADQYRANAERLEAAANQYGEEARQAEAEIAALQAAQNQPPADPATPAAASSAAAPVSSVGAVSPEPQISAPASAAQEIPVPSVEDAAMAQSAGQSAEGSGGQSERPSETMASVGMTVLPDTGGIPVGGVLGAATAIVAGGLFARRIFR